MKPSDYRVLIRGAGELASGTAHHLYTQGFQNILMLERRYPKAVRRQVCFSEAILDGATKVQGVLGRYVRNVDEAETANDAGAIAIAALDLDEVLHTWQPKIFIEAAMLRKNWGLKREIAPVVIALGPGYVARKDCDAVVETVRGPQVGAVLEDTGERLRDEPPAEIMGYGGERAVKAVRDGIFFTQLRIGGRVERGERIGTVVSVYGVEDFRQGVPVDASYPVKARISGILRGLLRDGVPVKQGDRIADIDPRGSTDDLDHISDKARRVAEGVHEALLGLIAEMERRRPKSRKKKSGAAATKKKAKPGPTRGTKAKTKNKAKPKTPAKKPSAKTKASSKKTTAKPKRKPATKSAAKASARGARRSTKG
ncbi:MAG: selenium-dependent molybdenum cofactor biosynthesis protein YqeB [Planctomycetota bacterium]